MAARVQAPATGGRTKLTSKDVKQIRRMWETTNLSQREIGEKFGVHQVTVSGIVRGVTWQNVG